MAVRMTHTCDYALDECAEDAPIAIEVTVDDIIHRADYCPQHHAEMMEAIAALGFKPSAGWVDGRRRDVHIAASGAAFTTADARKWLIAKGLKTGAAQGRVSEAQLRLYADNH